MGSQIGGGAWLTPAPAPVRWRYSMQSNGVSLATYLGDVQIDGIINATGATVASVANYAALTALTNPVNGGLYCTLGYAAANDGGFGFWYYSAASVVAANGGTILAINGGGAGRFFRQYSGDMNAQWFGFAAANTAAQNAAALLAAVTAAAGLRGVFIPPLGATADCNPVPLPSNTKLYGIGTRAALSYNSATPLFDLQGSQIEVENLLITGAGATAPPFRIDTGTASRQQIYIRNCELDDCPGIIDDDNHATQTADEVYLSNITAYRNRGIGVNFKDVVAFLFLNEVAIDFNGSSSKNFTGFYVANNEGAILTNCDVLGDPTSASQHGFNFVTCTSIWLERTMADSCGADGYRFDNAWYVQGSDNRAAGCAGEQVHWLADSRYSDVKFLTKGRKSLAGAAGKCGTLIEGACLNIAVSGLAYDCTGNGVKIIGSSARCSLNDVQVLDVTLAGVLLDDADYTDVGAINIVNATGNGITVQGGSYSSSFSGGVIRGCGGHGIEIAGGGASGHSFAGFSITGCTGRAIKESGAGNSAIFSGFYGLSNAAGNYDLAGSFVHINGMGLSSGAYLASATGPATG